MLLDEELDEALAERATHEAVSKAELLRRFAREALEPSPPSNDPLSSVAGLAGPDEKADAWTGRVSENVTHVLYPRSER